MISYRKLAMRVLGHSPVSAVKTARRSTGKRAAALALTAALVVGMTLPAFAQDLSLIHISEPTRQYATSRMPSSA